MVGHDLLAGLRDSCPDCVLAAFLDLETKMILAVDAVHPPAQELLNGLAQSAHDTLIGPSALTIAKAVSNGDHFSQAIMIDTADLTVFVSRPDAAGEAICCIAKPATDVASLTQAAQDALARLISDAA